LRCCYILFLIKQQSHHGLSKRERLAQWIYATGVHKILCRLPKQNSLLVLNYHRLGDPGSTPYDAGVFSTTAEEFEAQVAFITRHLLPVNLKEALAFITGNGTDGRRECRALITFDDGYLDNFEIAYPILKQYRVQGAFFLPTAFIGTQDLPWWDIVAFIVRTARTRKFTLQYPECLALDLNVNDVGEVIRQILRLFKRPEMTNSERFIAELETASRGHRPDVTGERCFMDWDEARQMYIGGMAIGGHTHTHRLLGRLPLPEQWQELTECRRILREKVGIDADAMAYPVGSTTSFTSETKYLVEQAGYRAAFSYYGGINRPGKLDRFDVHRVPVDWSTLQRFTIQTTFAALASCYWP
jgi:peptidoglycan/xylan/chitin deacetylase (PgdA/CDA1 family)